MMSARNCPASSSRTSVPSIATASTSDGAMKHFHATAHPIIEGYGPPEGWGWCFVDKVMVDLRADTTPQRGPIPRFY